MEISQNFVAFSEYMNFNLSLFFFWKNVFFNTKLRNKISYAHLTWWNCSVSKEYSTLKVSLHHISVRKKSKFQNPVFWLVGYLNLDLFLRTDKVEKIEIQIIGGKLYLR